LWGGTFHSIGARILRLHASLVGFRPDFTILDREDSTDLIKACLADADEKADASALPKADALAELFSMAANTRQSIAEMAGQIYRDFDLPASRFERLAAQYAERKRAANLMDFDDLMVQWLNLLQQHPEVAEAYQRRFQFILVDEYQDTNQLQSDLIDLLAARHQNVMVVGDDSQSIYSWRGANFRNIFEFPRRYPAARTYKIETNYRSTPEILALANAAIAPNERQFSKVLTSARKPGAKPVLAVCGDAREQAAFVAQRALELNEEGVSLNGVAVLYRSHFHALELQLELVRRKIPFSITSGIRFFEQAHIKDVAAYLKLVVNPTDELAFKRLVQMLPGVGGKSADKIWKKFQADWTSRAVDAWNPEEPMAGDASAQAGEATPLASALQRCASIVPKKAATAWAELAITLSQIEVEPIRRKPASLIRHVLEAGYQQYLQNTFDKYNQRLDDLEQLANFAQQ
ncbi:MAG TPA: ATP-dependent helicase, partial [Gemmatimonadales bacterium]|nr:ATP-dependent helicase [Gemmatimonadales bacterium]